ncbi:Ig-like domain-containing protein [Nocardioides sp. CPCC 206347]|uniref:Ig-like domain-containing protein n=1 Tax=unclassified Nocardioides TaxID=2615069 RepID=UPI00361FAC0A
MGTEIKRASVAVRTVIGVLALIVLAIGLVVTSGRSENATAAEVPATIEVSTTATSVAQWDRVDFICRWQVPDHSRPGDTFTLTLPDALRWMGPTTFALLAPDGVTPVANAVVAGGPPWVVTFTLTDYVSTHPLNVNGTCRFSTQYVKTVNEGEAVDLEFDVSGGVSTVPLTGSNPCQTGCEPPPAVATKWIWWSDPADQRRSHSVLLSPQTPIDGTTVTITDTPRPGLSIDCATVVVTVGDSRANDGTVIADLTATYPDPGHIVCTPTSLTATWELPAGWYMNVALDSDVTDPDLAEYHNDGTVALSGQDPATVTSELERTEAGGDGEGDPVDETTTPTDTSTGPTDTSSGPTEVATSSVEASTVDESPASSSHDSAVVPIGADGDLPETGSNLTPWPVLAGALLLIAGALLVGRTRS